MTVTYGFYDSVSSDRVYNAEQMGRMFDGVLQDGIFAFEGDGLEVVEYSGMTVQVESGRAWFNHTWTLNDANLDVVVPTAHATLNRIDIVYLETNKNSAVRANKIDILEGTPASSPVPPTLASGPEQYQYALAHIYVGAGVTSIYTANITDKRGVDTDFALSGLYSYIEPLSVDTEHLATDAVTTAKVADNQITNPLLRDSAALSVIGRAGNSVGDPADIVAGTDGYVLRRSGTTVGFGTIVAAGLASGAVTAGKIATGGVSASAQIANDIINSQHYAAGSIDLEHMAANSVDSDQYVDGSIDPIHIANRIRKLSLFYVPLSSNGPVIVADGAVFPDGVTRTIHGSFAIPNNFVSNGNIKFYGRRGSAVSGVVIWGYEIDFAAENETYNTHVESGSDGSNFIDYDIELLDSKYLNAAAIGDLVRWSAYRNGAHVSDTLAADLVLINVVFEYDADS